MRQQRGAVSIFIVIFTALLTTVVTTSFVRVMLGNQQQASDNDLSQSAYDSAMAGVEDAKRALVQLKKCQLNPGASGCTTQFISDMGTLAKTDCEALDTSKVGVADFQGTKHEVRVGDEALNQAYTCVLIKVETDSYDGQLTTDHEAVVIPLVPAGVAPNNIQRVRVSWFTRDDIDPLLTNPTVPGQTVLPPYDSWAANRPPMIRAQLIQFDGNTDITLSDFDTKNAWTRLLYPQVGQRPTSTTPVRFADDTRRTTGTNSPSYGGCEQNFSYGGYACSVELLLPAMTNPATQTREAYLHLAGIYIKQGAHYKVEMLGAGGPTDNIKFDNVQPEVDSTGRASDLYRRVKARVTVFNTGTPYQYPEAALSTGNICKEFFITGDPANYNSNGNGQGTACTP